MSLSSVFTGLAVAGQVGLGQGLTSNNSFSWRMEPARSTIFVYPVDDLEDIPNRWWDLRTPSKTARSV